jgi:hypothetical protein
MKKLLLIALLMPIIAVAQMTKTEFDNAKTGPAPWAAKGTTVTTHPFKGQTIGNSPAPIEADLDTYIIHVVAQKWASYKRVCYADSAYDCKTVYDMVGMKNPIGVHTHCEWKMYHKTPTLEGFMNYISKIK